MTTKKQRVEDRNIFKTVKSYLPATYWQVPAFRSPQFHENQTAREKYSGNLRLHKPHA
jgi:hypothetical protein